MGTDEKSDIEVFADANQEFQQTIGELDPEAPGYAAEVMQAIDDFLSRVAESDPGEMVKEQAASIVSEHTDQTKKTARRELNNYLREAKRESRDRPEICEIMRHDVDRVEALASNETDGDVRYRVVIGDESIVVNDEGLWSSTQLRRAVTPIYGRVPVFDPEDGSEWEGVIDEIYDEKLVWKYDAVGPRMQVVERVRELVEKHAAYTDISRAYVDSGVYVDEPDAEVVWVESSRIEERANEHDENLAGVRWEMDDKDLRVGESKRMRVDTGKHKNFWPLDRSGFEPKRVETGDDQDFATDGGAAA